MSEPVSEPDQSRDEHPGGERPDRANPDRAHSDGEHPEDKRPEDEQSGDGHSDERALPESLTFRILPTALLAVLAIAVCVTPLAFAHPALLMLFLLPVGLAYWILRLKTVVTPDRITSRMLLRTREIDWQDVRRIRLNERRWLRAVLDSGQEILLPAVRVRDLPRVAAMSGGLIPDPTATSEQDRPTEQATDAPQAAGIEPDTETGPETETEQPTETGQDTETGSAKTTEDGRDQR
ncbi:PH domain-containing protein [Parasphingorhabdus pacifica]